MKRLMLAASSALALISCAPLQERASSPPPTDVAQPALQSLVDSYISAGRMPGIVVAIGRGDAPPTFISAGAISDDPGAPRAGPDSLWRIYSMTKPLTAIAAMILVEDGRLSLDQPIGDLIPAFRTMRVLDAPAASLDSHPASRPITVRHLLTHSSGLTYQFLGNGPLQREYQRLGLLGGRADAEASRAQPATLAEFAERVASLPLLAEPGTRWNYSISTDVLGRVVEVASGMSFERFLQRRLLDPLGMNSTYWTVPQAEAGRLSTIYSWSGENRVALDPGMTSAFLNPPRVHYGGSGLVSSARDYDRFLQMLAGRGRVGHVRILRRETVDLAMSNLLPDGVRLTGIATPDTAQAEGFGAGGWVYLADAPQGVRAGTYGWSGAGGTIAFIDPRQGLRVTVMVNYFPPNKWPLHNDVVRTLYSN
jgi:CubicO group peptidase (beta-lactamase class C family)